MKGPVKSLNNSKGFGFIVPEDSSEDVFAHFSQIKMEGYRTLKTNQAVEFDLVDGEKGKQAQNIQPVTQKE
jgi:CspA family cold shock protein